MAGGIERPAARDPELAGASRPVPRWRFLAAWAVVWGLVGCAVGAGIVFVSDIDAGPALRISILFAEVVGFTALVSARGVFPLFVRLPWALGLVLQVLTLLSATVFGSVAVALVFPLLSLRQGRVVALIVLANALIAVVVGIALHTYDTLSRRLEESYLALREKEALERELRFAREVQQQLLPTDVPRTRGLELAGVCLPAAGVAGDYYDFLGLSDDELGLVIADVSGKGMSAALLMAGLQAAVRSLMRPGSDPAELVRAVNAILCRSVPAARYATLFIGIYDARTRLLRYSNAGHLPPLVLGPGGTSALVEGGIPVGLFENPRYTGAERRLEPGDLLALFTDGVVETPDANETEFGTARLLALLARERHGTLDAIVATALEELHRFAGPSEPHDDVTLLLARVL